MGRTLVKSMNSSASMRATTRGSWWAPMNSTAAEAASPASFQPPNAATSTGLRRAGRSVQITSDTLTTVYESEMQPARDRSGA